MASLIEYIFQIIIVGTQDKNPKSNWKQSVARKAKKFFSISRIMQNENSFIGLLCFLFVPLIRFKVSLTIDNGDIIHMSEMQKYLININFN